MPDCADNLLERAKHGDEAALVELLRRHEPRVRAAIAGRVPTRHRAGLSEDDVVQETFAVAFRKIGQLNADVEGAFVRWLQTTARRNLRDAVKHLDTEKQGGDKRRASNAISMLLSAGGTGPSTGADRSIREGLLRNALSQLPEDYARVIELYDLEGRAAQEVADALGRSMGAVFMLRARALEWLHDHLPATSDFFSASS